MADEKNKRKRFEDEHIDYTNERSGKTEYAPRKQSWFGKTVEAMTLPYSARREISRKRGDEPIEK